MGKYIDYEVPADLQHITQCALCKHYNSNTNTCTNPHYKAKWDIKAVCPGYQELK